MATKKFIIEVEEGYTLCSNCPIECDGKCVIDKFEETGLDCDILDLATMKITEMKDESK